LSFSSAYTIIIVLFFEQQNISQLQLKTNQALTSIRGKENKLFRFDLTHGDCSAEGKLKETQEEKELVFYGNATLRLL